jgi:hypothetical protein
MNTNMVAVKKKLLGNLKAKTKTNKQTNSVILVRKQTTPMEG